MHVTSILPSSTSVLLCLNGIILFYVALFDQVRKQQSALIRGLHLDGKLLAQLNERKLLTEEDFSAINAHIMGLNNLLAKTHFVNAVMFRWTFEVFESNVRHLTEALLIHDDSGNQSVASKLCRSFTECGLDVPRVEDAST